MFSLIRFSPPRHAVRHEKRGVIRHPATKVVAAPLVTATAVAMDFIDSPPQTPGRGLEHQRDTADRPSAARRRAGATDHDCSRAPTTVADPPQHHEHHEHRHPLVADQHPTAPPPPLDSGQGRRPGPGQGARRKPAGPRGVGHRRAAHRQDDRARRLRRLG